MKRIGAPLAVVWIGCVFLGAWLNALGHDPTRLIQGLWVSLPFLLLCLMMDEQRLR
jgi:hypothetical protein